MKLKLAVAALALAIATPAFAVEYYVVQNAKSKKCSVATKKPASDKVVMVGDAAGYKTKKDAQAAQKAADACKAKPATGKA
jgi:hypothetical protein